jgi:hypothetical protein
VFYAGTGSCVALLELATQRLDLGKELLPGFAIVVAGRHPYKPNLTIF